MSSIPTTLREFMTSHHDELATLCVRKVHERFPSRCHDGVGDCFRSLVAEIIGALEDGDHRVTSDAGARHGAEQQTCGDTIENVALELGVIFEAMSDLGTREDLRFGANECLVFNNCVDAAIASAIEQFARQQREAQETTTNARVGFIAHELRNALSSARMAFSTLKRGSNVNDGKTNEILKRSLDRLRTLVEHMVLAVRTHSGIPPELKPTRIAPVLFEVTEATPTERGVTIDVTADDSLVARADEHLLSSALGNLVQNAVKFSHDAGRVSLRARAEDGAIIIEVEDECGGLPQGHNETFFHPFKQASSDRRGLGLGLSITKEAIEAQHGEIDVHDLRPKGCLFTVRLQRA